MDKKMEDYFKVLLAFWIVLSHLPFLKVLNVYNYLPVAAFFFFSGYGLMKKKEEGKTFNLINCIKKVYLPFISLTFIYILMFEKINLWIFIKNALLLDISLPYGWYVRTQIILYIIWFISLFFKDKEQIFITFLMIITYTIIFKYSGQIFTSFKTVYAFLFGILISKYEKNINNKYINLFTFFICCFISFGIRFVISKNETILDLLLYNFSGILFSFCLYYLVLKIDFKNIILDFFKNFSYEIYLVQGIVQCFIMKTDFCPKSYLNITNNAIIVLCSFIFTLVLSYFVYLFDKNIFFRKKREVLL